MRIQRLLGAATVFFVVSANSSVIFGALLVFFHSSKTMKHKAQRNDNLGEREEKELVNRARPGVYGRAIVVRLDLWVS